MKHKMVAVIGSVLLSALPMYPAFAADTAQNPSLKFAAVRQSD